ncbi:ribonuclease H-like domain-containing protein, partial [Sparassis latifolia]
YVLHVFDTSAKRKTGANLFIHMEEEYRYITNTLKLEFIGLCSDAGSNERKGHILFLQKYPWALVADCWSHQICLMLGDYYKHNPQVKTVVDAALEVIKWFNNHLFALGVLNEEQQLMYHKILALILPVITRWTSHFCSLSCLLETWKALQITSIKHNVKLIESAGRSVKSKRKAKRVLQHVRNDEWWKKLVIVKMHIEPLAIATNVSQGANTRCDQVLLLLGNLYRSYFNIPDQDLFITCLFLNPFINSSLLNGTTLSMTVIMGIIRRLYLRVFRTETSPEDLMRSVYEYHTCFGMFFAENWPLNDLKEGLKDEVCGIMIRDGTCDPLRVWHILDKKNSLVKLADLVLSFVPSSATTERLFTKMGDTKTKKRSRLGIQKNRDMAYVKTEIRRQ